MFSCRISLRIYYEKILLLKSTIFRGDYRAGLKSNMALNSPWNIHVRDAIETHNKNVREGLASSELALEHRRTFRDDNRNLRKQLKDMEIQRNMALESIAIYQTECDELKKEVRRLESRINRLQQ